MVLIAVIIAYTINFYFSLALIIWSIFFISISFILSKDVTNYSRDFAQIRSILSGRYVDSLMNVFNINIFARQSFEKKYLEQTSYEVVKKDIALLLIQKRISLLFFPLKSLTNFFKSILLHLKLYGRDLKNNIISSRYRLKKTKKRQDQK